MWGSVSVWVQKGAVEVEDKRVGGGTDRGGEGVDCEGGGRLRDGKSMQQKALGVEGTTLEKVKKERTVLAQDDKYNIWKRKSCVWMNEKRKKHSFI